MNTHTPLSVEQAPFRPIDFLARDIDLERRADGTCIMRSRIPLRAYETHIPAYLAQHAKAQPDILWLAQRRGPQRAWHRVSYGEGKRIVDALTQALLDLNMPQDRPLAILSGNSIEHALMTQAGMQARLPVAPVSPAYSLISQDHSKLRYIFDLIRPGIVMVQDGVMFQKALDALAAAQLLDDVVLIHVERAAAGHKSRAFADLAATPVTGAVEKSLEAITGKTVGKLLFTSGSTGMPKAVINTQEMMCANTMMGKMARSKRADDPPTIVLDWLPWNHTMGGNAGFNSILADGGSLYIDDGRPIPGMFNETLNNLREIAPTYYSNVPAGYAVLATAMEQDEALCQNFFKDLRVLAYGGATLPDDLYLRMQKLAVRTTGHRIVFMTGWGSTETAPTATSTYWATERVGLIGLPHPGVELKMVPVGNKYELRLRGIIVTPGYYRQPELTAAAFDEEGYYKIGDAGVFVDESDPAQGLIFSGRVVEDFKLTSGTFVHVGSLRVASIAAASPALQDALVAGQDREFVGLLAWPNLEACRLIAGRVDANMDEIIIDPKVMEHVREHLVAHNKSNPGSSMRIARAILMSEPPSVDGNELTDKGYINQRAALDRRKALVERLYAAKPDASVIVIA